jgi:hypothetical protein
MGHAASKRSIWRCEPSSVCCSFADGVAVSDVDWESKGGHYRVRLENHWIDVPDDALITEPNQDRQNDGLADAV